DSSSRSATTGAGSTSCPRSDDVSWIGGSSWSSGAGSTERRGGGGGAGRWRDDTPGPDGWGRVAQGGGQVVEQATHLYDLARHLAGEATVVGAVSTAVPPPPSDRVVDVVGSTSAVLRFDAGAAGS